MPPFPFERRRLPVLGLLAALGLAGCHKEPVVTGAPPAPQVEGQDVVFPAGAPQLSYLSVQPARARQVAVSHLTGRLYWNDDATVRIFTPVAGQVSAIRADLGQTVSVGSPLAEINSPDFGQARADARTAQANLAAADRTYSRDQDLLAHGAAAQKDVEAAQAAYLAALAERDRAVARLTLYGGDERRTDETYVLRSPLAGVVVEKSINPGQEVRADQMLANALPLYAPLFVVSDPTRLWLQVDVAETDLASLQTGEGLRVSSPAFPGRVFAGRIADIGPTLDPTTRTVKVRGAVDNPDRLLKAEMYVLVDVVQPESPAAAAGLEISSKAIFTIDNRNYLFVASTPGRYERREVTIGTEKDGVVPVFSGVAVGENVVTEGALLLQSILEPAD